MTQHNWIPSPLGHGETMCSRCLVTNREAAALGISEVCDRANGPHLAVVMPPQRLRTMWSCEDCGGTFLVDRAPATGMLIRCPACESGAITYVGLDFDSGTKLTQRSRVIFNKPA